MREKTVRRRISVILAAVALTSACGTADVGEETAETGQTLTIWTRAATEAQTRGFVDAYNALGRNQVELTVVPNDTYLQQVATAAGGRSLPDLLGADVVYARNFIRHGFYTDLGERLAETDLVERLAPAHLDAGTADGAYHAVPHTLDLSLIFYNKVLYREAGLDPEQPPETLPEMMAHAEAISALGGDVSGTYFGGNCPGCLLFTLWPMVWADGGEVLTADGTASAMDVDTIGPVFQAYRDAFAAGIAPASSAQENGISWLQPFAEGRVGVAPLGSTMLRLMPEHERLEIGVAPIRGMDGGESTFVGGDVLGITSTSTKKAAAWDFLSWTLSADVQRDVLTAGGDVSVRTDLIPTGPDGTGVPDDRLRTFHEVVDVGRVPTAVNFGATFNDPQGPWLQFARSAIFGPESVDEAIAAFRPRLDSSLDIAG
ncbi:multiple sugar transport system substrate-binding protein [Actinoalloteichus hoggarensis]|uniref:Glycerol-3-phosphate transporter periplasmic binding protein n=1 Tax=Actinoalloteichus hoggarensis TaxID=1470176 RepID=A0A221W4L8_9PSEU|nr:sugar ABC transporter substrate-binding protein [Actinoalloteichus hoggarensis]ASO20795.1 glycerol-3-phosphate transporter periplasmic binding protein [Actinoalloteichus hoggarensis]MBB5920725.1 multiple sugar transport system substrate-binding protein [Actinoalloteichus hoggarensis]